MVPFAYSVCQGDKVSISDFFPFPTSTHIPCSQPFSNELVYCIDVILICPSQLVDPRQELLEKIEYYQSEHDRLLDEVRVLKRRLGEITPKSPRSRSPAISPRRGRDRSPYREASPRRNSPNRLQASKVY